jgi:RimJ/RimL family protein N-acetyltransferase
MEDLRMYPVELHGELVRLREFRMDDVDAALEIVGNDTVARWLSFDSRDRDQTTDMLKGAVERSQLVPREEYYLAVVLPGSDRVVGFVRLGLTGVKAAKLGYAVHADSWGKGYASDAARTMITFGFGELDLHRITAAIGPDNESSISVVKKLGFQYEGCLRDHVFTNGAWRDSLLYSLLTSEWNG